MHVVGALLVGEDVVVLEGNNTLHAAAVCNGLCSDGHVVEDLHSISTAVTRKHPEGAQCRVVAEADHARHCQVPRGVRCGVPDCGKGEHSRRGGDVEKIVRSVERHVDAVAGDGKDRELPGADCMVHTVQLRGTTHVHNVGVVCVLQNSCTGDPSAHRDSLSGAGEGGDGLLDAELPVPLPAVAGVHKVQVVARQVNSHKHELAVRNVLPSGLLELRGGKVIAQLVHPVRLPVVHTIPTHCQRRDRTCLARCVLMQEHWCVLHTTHLHTAQQHNQPPHTHR